MRSSKRELLELIEALPSVSVLVVGDIILDRYVWGAADRISPEAPVPVVAVTRTEDRLGGAGNVVRNLAEVGVSVKVAGIIGDDLEGEQVLNLLDIEDSTSGLLISKGRPTSVKTRVIARAQQVVRIDREDSSPHTPALQSGFAATIATHMNQVDAVIVSDYGKGVISEPVWNVFQKAQKKGVPGANSRPLVLDPHPVNYHLYKGVTVAKPNRKEAELASGITIRNYDDAVRAAEILRKKWDAERLVITLGSLGMAIVPGNDSNPISIETRAQQVFDVSGAGDCVTALYTAAIAAGATPQLAGDLANIGAGIVVSEVGTVPIQLNKLLDVINTF